MRRYTGHLPFKVFSIITVLTLVTINVVGYVRAHGGDASLIHSCIGEVNGRITIVGINDTCGQNETALDWIKNVIEGTGIAISRDSSGATISISNGGVGTVQLADDSVTSEKIAEGAIAIGDISESASSPSRLQTWNDGTTYVYSATGNKAVRGTLDPDITVTVPAGKAHYYLVDYSGLLRYNMSERPSSNPSGFHAEWDAQLRTNSSTIGHPERIMWNEYRKDWSTTGSYWITPVNASWVIRLEEGTYNLTIQISGYSDNTMNYVRFFSQNIQVMRLL